MTDIEILKSDILSTQSGVGHAFFTRKGGVSEGLYATLNGGLSSEDDPKNVQENRRRMADYIDVKPSHLLSCYQIHSATCVTVDALWKPEDRPRADALVTKMKGVALSVLTADCVPVLFADASAGVIGAAHAGWRGAFVGVLENTLHAMEKLGAHKHHICAALGPCIWQKDYEVDHAFMQNFLNKNVEDKIFFIPSSNAGHFMFDLPAYVQARLKKNGVMHVGASVGNTYADQDRFYSYRLNCQKGIAKAPSLVSTIFLL